MRSTWNSSDHREVRKETSSGYRLDVFLFTTSSCKFGLILLHRTRRRRRETVPPASVQLTVDYDVPCRTRGHVQFALRAQLNELKNCHALQLGEEVPKKTQLTGTQPVEPYQPANHPWVVPVILPDRQESDKMAELPHRCSNGD